MIDKYRVKDNIDLKLLEQKGFVKQRLTSGEDHWANVYVRIVPNVMFSHKLKGYTPQEIVFYDFLHKNVYGYEERLELKWNWKSEEEMTPHVQDLLEDGLIEKI